MARLTLFSAQLGLLTRSPALLDQSVQEDSNAANSYAANAATEFEMALQQQILMQQQAHANQNGIALGGGRSAGYSGRDDFVGKACSCLTM